MSNRNDNVERIKSEASATGSGGGGDGDGSDGDSVGNLYHNSQQQSTCVSNVIIDRRSGSNYMALAHKHSYTYM